MALAALAASLALAGFTACAEAQILGANFNERPRDTDIELLDASKTDWVRGFIDVFAKQGDGNPLSDPDIVGLRRASASGKQVIFSFKWNFLSADRSVPSPGSQEESELFTRAVELLQAVGRPINTIVLGNEPMFETQDADLNFVGGAVPYVRFTERLLDHLTNNFGESQQIAPRYFVGSLNRLDLQENRTRDLTQELFRVARENDAIAGMDIHTHFNGIGQADSMMEFAREQLGPTGKDLLVTEFSPVWRYKAAMMTEIGSSPSGAAFAGNYGYAPTMLANQYLQHAFDNQVSRVEWTDFIQSQSWFNPDHLDDMHELFREHGVTVATLGFSQPLSMRGMNVTHANYPPFHINWLYIHALVNEGSFLESYNERYMDDWLGLQAGLADIDQDQSVDLEDYDLIKHSFGDDLSGRSFSDALRLGDINLDRQIDHTDLLRFFEAYEQETGRTIGDLDSDGFIDGRDWADLLLNLESDVSALSTEQAWAMGDLDLSGYVDRRDFRLFKDAYTASFGMAAFSALGAAPEPASAALGWFAAMAFVCVPRHSLLCNRS